MGNYSFFIYVIGIIAMVMIANFFRRQLRILWRVCISTIIGGLAFYIINVVGSNFNFHIGLNWVTLLTSGFLGIPGILLITILKFII